MPDWHPEMPRILAALDQMRERHKPLFPRRMSSCSWGPDGKVMVLMTRRHYALLLIRRAPWRVNGWLCHIRRWRRFMCEWNRPVDCTCTFEEIDNWPCSGHPGPDCPLRTHCGGYDGPCGGCDDCIDRQIGYYEAKSKGLL